MLIGAAALILSACATPPSTQGPDSLTGRIFIAGDSTAADYPAERAPQIGWGQTLRYFVTEPSFIQNRAVNGRSTRSFLDEGKWEALLSEIGPGDTVLISFGHNDARDDDPRRFTDAETEFRSNLERFAGDVRQKGAFAVILSPAARRLWEGPAMVETHGLYRKGAAEAAAAAGARYIDLSLLSLTYFETIGREETKLDYLWLAPDPAHARFPDGVEDNTHFTELGACGLAMIIAEQLARDKRLAPVFQTGQPLQQAEATGIRPGIVEACAAAVSASR